ATTGVIKSDPTNLNDFQPTAREVFPWDFKDPQGAVVAPRQSAVATMVRLLGERTLADKKTTELEKGYKTIQTVTSQVNEELKNTTKDARQLIEGLPNKILAEVAKV